MVLEMGGIFVPLGGIFVPLEMGGIFVPLSDFICFNFYCRQGISYFTRNLGLFLSA